MNNQNKIQEIRDELKRTHEAMRNAQHEDDKATLREVSRALNLALARLAGNDN